MSWIARRFARIGITSVALALMVSACAQDGTVDVTAALTPPAETSAVSKPEPQSAPAKAQTPAVAPAGADAAPELVESRRKRAAGDKAGALAVLDRAAGKGEKDPAIQRERGLLALDLGHVKKAETILKPLVVAKPDDWRVHSALGAALAAQARQPEAQQHFAKALELSPDNSSVLNNLALSYALDGKAAEAERLLARVAAGKQHAPRAKQNLALLAGLGGRLEEAERIAASALPADLAKRNVALLAQSGVEPASGPTTSTQPRSKPERAASTAPTGDTMVRLGGPKE